MYEKAKLEEAKYFLQQMEALVNEPTTFLYVLSAFLSAARSVLQYTYEEVKKNPRKLKWYEKQVNGNSILKFFKDKRNLNIHTKPIKPSIHISINEHIRVSESVRIEIHKEDGSREVRENILEPFQTRSESSESEIRYEFEDWQGSEDIINLSHQYIAALENFIHLGLNDKAISG